MLVDGPQTDDGDDKSGDCGQHRQGKSDFQAQHYVRMVMPERGEDEQENSKQHGKEEEAGDAGDHTDDGGSNQSALHKDLIVAAGYSPSL